MTTAHKIFTVIEFSSSEIRGMVVKTEANGRSSRIGGTRHESTGLSRGGITDLNAAVETLQWIKLDLETQAGIAIGSVTAGISGAQMNSMVSTGIAAVSGKEVAWNDIAQAAECAASPGITADRRPVFAAIRKFMVDGQEEVRNPVGMPGTRLDVELLLVTGSVFALECIEKAFARAAIAVDRMVPTVFSLAQGILLPEEVLQGALLVDPEERATGLTVWSTSGPAYLEVIPKGIGDDIPALTASIWERLDQAGMAEQINRVVIAEHGTDVTALRDGLSAAREKAVRVDTITFPFSGKAEQAALVPLFLMTQTEGLSIPIQEKQERRPFETFKWLFRTKEQDALKSFTTMMPLHR